MGVTAVLATILLVARVLCKLLLVALLMMVQCPLLLVASMVSLVVMLQPFPVMHRRHLPLYHYPWQGLLQMWHRLCRHDHRAQLWSHPFPLLNLESPPSTEPQCPPYIEPHRPQRQPSQSHQRVSKMNVVTVHWTPMTFIVQVSTRTPSIDTWTPSGSHGRVASHAASTATSAGYSGYLARPVESSTFVILARFISRKQAGKIARVVAKTVF